MSLLLRNILWIVLCPGTVTLLLPFYILNGWQLLETWEWEQWAGAFFILTGAVALLWCIYDFATRGKGTLSPVDPTKHLVVNGLYRYVRNPMYVGVVTILAGESLFFWSMELVIYGAVVFLAFNIFIRVYEEPYLRKTFGGEYEQYCRHVNRWLPGKPFSINHPNK